MPPLSLLAPKNVATFFGAGNLKLMEEKIYERQKYQQILAELSKGAAGGDLPVAVIGGRRRLGKSYVPARYFGQRTPPPIYVLLKCPIGANEADTLNSLKSDLKEALLKLHFSLPLEAKSLTSFIALLEEVLCQFQDPFLIIHIDEIQEFRRFESVEGVLAALIDKWRIRHNRQKGALLLTGSMWRHLDPMFSDSNRPLFGRETHRHILYPWSPTTLAELVTGNDEEKGQNLLTVFSFSGGVPWYLELLKQKGFLEHAHTKAWEIVRELFIYGPLRNEHIEVINAHLRGDARALFQGLAEGKSKRGEYEDILAPGNYNNFKRFIQSINQNYEFIDYTPDPLFPNQSGLERIRVRDSFLAFSLGMGRQLLDTPHQFIDAARGELFDKQWLHHEGWVLEELLYRLIGAHASTLGWKINYKNYGFRISIAGSAEMDIVSYSKKERWIQLIEAKRSLQPSYLEESYHQKKLHVLKRDLEKKYPAAKVDRWECSYKLVFAHDSHDLASSSAYEQGEIVSLSSLLIALGV